MRRWRVSTPPTIRTTVLTLDFDSDWGFLIRTSTTSWDDGTSSEPPTTETIIEMGVPFTMTSSSSAANIQFSLPTMYHSHFWTAAFADLNYGKAAEGRDVGSLQDADRRGRQMGGDGAWTDSASTP